MTNQLSRWATAALAGVAMVAAATVPAAGHALRPDPAAPAPGAAAVAAAAAGVPGHVIVRLTEAAGASALLKSDLGARGRTGLAGLDAALAAIGADRVEPLLRFPARTPDAQGRLLNRSLLVRYAGTDAPLAAAARLVTAAEVERAGPDCYVLPTSAPNDPLYPDQWAHDNQGQVPSYWWNYVGTPDFDTDTDRAWDLAAGGAGVVIALLDSGVDFTHPEFAGRLLPGYDFLDDDGDPADIAGHGTACAGILAAQANNAQGIAGVAWLAQLLPLRVFAGVGAPTGVAPLLSALVHAGDVGADIISLSASVLGPELPELEAAIVYAYNHGCAIFCSAGNEDHDYLDQPATYTQYVFPIGALSPCGDRKTPSSCDEETWWGSNHDRTCLFTPGVRITTTDILGAGGLYPNDYAGDFNGTSAATPHAAGIGALVLALNPSLSPYQLKAVLVSSCEDMGAPGPDEESGFGKLNALLAVLGAFQVPTYSRAGYVGTELGTLHQPFNTFEEGAQAVPTDGTLIVSGGTYDLTAPLTLSRPMIIRGINGLAVIGP